MAIDGIGGGPDFGAQQMENTLGAFERGASDVVGIFSPTGRLVDGIAGALHLPDPIKQIAKLALGIATGDIFGAISGALGLTGDVTQEMAKTQYHPSTKAHHSSSGYAPADPGNPGGPGSSAYAPANPGNPGGPRGPSKPAESLEDRMFKSLGAAQREVDALEEQALKDPDNKELQAHLQKAENKLEALNAMLTNMLKSQHEMAMAAIQNMGR